MILWATEEIRSNSRVTLNRAEKAKRRSHTGRFSSSALCYLWVTIKIYLTQRLLIFKDPQYCNATNRERLQKYCSLVYTVPWIKSLGGAGACWANSARLFTKYDQIPFQLQQQHQLCHSLKLLVCVSFFLFLKIKRTHMQSKTKNNWDGPPMCRVRTPATAVKGRI